MSKPRWYFKKQPKGFRDRNPIQNAFFDSEAVGSVIHAMAREGLQNSGDAGDGIEGPVRVRIFVSGEKYALPAERARFWGGDLWEHVGAEDSGLRNPPVPDEPCRFLAFEDFNTTGLEGDFKNDDPQREPFYCFFRAENATSKDENAGGSWGVGKTAFPRASRANALFALTTRNSDDQTLLMGSLTLRTRHVGKDKVKYTPDSWYGVGQPDEDEGGIVQPVTDPDITYQFKNDFHLTRSLSAGLEARRGTSIVVPWCDVDPEGDDEEMTRASVVRAVVETNFLPIIMGRLEVSVGDTPDTAQDVVLNPETIEAAVAELKDDDLLASVRLAKWMREEGGAARVAARHQPGSGVVKWDQYDLPETELDRLRIRYDAGEPVLVRVPVPLREKGSGKEVTSHLEVALQRSPNGNTIRPVFIRGSVVVPDSRIKRVPGSLAIINTQADVLGNLLRAAEDPGHKEWSSDTDNFIRFRKYVYAKSYLNFARDTALQVQRLLQDDESEQDFDVLGDVFALPKPPEDDGVKPGGGKGRKRKKVVVKPPGPIEPRQQLVAARKTAGGFRITRGSKDGPAPKQITVWTGYARRKGDGIHKWDAADFDLSQPPIEIESEGVELKKVEGNQIRMTVTDAQFSVVVTGFAPSRGDVMVRVRPEGRFDA